MYPKRLGPGKVDIPMDEHVTVSKPLFTWRVLTDRQPDFVFRVTYSVLSSYLCGR
jgi:hypothetical protein